MWTKRKLLAVGGAAIVAACCGACTSLLGDFSVGTVAIDAAAGSLDSTTTVDSEPSEEAAHRKDKDSGVDAALDAAAQDGACTAEVCVTAITAGGHHTCATLSDQTLRCWGSDTYGECGPNGTGTRRPVTVPGIGPVQYARASDTATCALLVDQSVWCWGDNSRGTLGTADADVAADGAPESPTPIQVMGPGTTSMLGIGAYHACILTTSTPPQLACWGANGFGQAGVADASSVSTPTLVAAATNVTSVTLGAFETCFQRNDLPFGECFGSNAYGELGQGLPSDAGNEGAADTGTADAGAEDARLADVGTGDARVADAGTADAHVADAGAAVDANTSGTDNMPHPVPAAVDFGGTMPSSFAHSAGNHMGIVLKSGLIATWGQDNDGQLGSMDDSGASQPTPALVPSFDDVTSMSFTQYASCALRIDGTVWCWGSTAYGQTGNTANGGPVQYAPAQVQGLAHVTAIAAALDHVCALLSDGTVDCWGWNTDGALGRATTSAVFDPSPAPVEF